MAGEGSMLIRMTAAAINGTLVLTLYVTVWGVPSVTIELLECSSRPPLRCRPGMGRSGWAAPAGGPGCRPAVHMPACRPDIRPETDMASAQNPFVQDAQDPAGSCQSEVHH